MISWLKQEFQRQSKLEGKIRLSFQLVLLSVAVVMAITLAVGIFVHYRMLTDALRDSTMKRYKDEVRHIVETMTTTIEATVPLEIGPNMDRTAQKSVIDTIHESRYDDGNGYFFMFDLKGNVVAQRIHRNREGTNRFDAVDADGKPYVQMLIEAAKQGGDFVEYKMDKPGEEGKGSFPKIAYAKLLRGNQWWVGSGVYVDAIDANIFALNKKLLLQVGFVMILSGGFLVGLLWIAFRLSSMLGLHITRPIAQLVEGANTLSAGKYGYRVEVDTHDEMKLLADRFNIMSATIDQQDKTMRALKSAVSNTRRRLAGELHNKVGNFVLDVTRELRNIASASEENVRGELLDNCSERVKDFRKKCEAIEWNVYPTQVDRHGVAIAFKYFVLNKTDQIGALQVDLDIDTDMPRSDIEREVALYLVAQGLLLNVVEHADASHVSISMRYADSGVILTIHDNGNGFEVEPVLRNDSIATSHFGLPWVKAQVEVYQGQFDPTSSLGSGTMMRVTIPWPTQPETDNGS